MGANSVASIDTVSKAPKKVLSRFDIPNTLLKPVAAASTATTTGNTRIITVFFVSRFVRLEHMLNTSAGFYGLASKWEMIASMHSHLALDFCPVMFLSLMVSLHFASVVSGTTP